MALHCARHGLRVALLERGPLDEAGARWVDAVPGWTFDQAKIERPKGDELVGAGATVQLIAGHEQLRCGYDDLLEVDMRHLVARLQRDAEAAGVALLSETRAESWDGSTLSTSAGAISPRWLVDASGLAGAKLLSQPATPTLDLCSAAQQVYEVVDTQGARAFHARYGAVLGDAISMIGIAGGYSTLGLRVSGDRVGILTGSIPAAGYPSGPALLSRFVEENAWIGARVFGGSRALPLGRPHDLLADDRVAIIGDAARQTFSAHGSGVGYGLIAARLCAEALCSGKGPRAYGVAFQRRHGGTLAAFDLFRRFSQTLATPELEALVATRLLSGPIVTFGLSQGHTLPSLPALMRAAAGGLTQPRLGARLTSVLTKMGLVLGLYAAYPKRAKALPRWVRRVERVFGGWSLAGAAHR